MSSEMVIRPHGGVLVNRVIDPGARSGAIAAASRMPRIRLTAVQHSDLLCIATGVFSPLTGFVGRDDYESILDRMRLANGTVWSIPAGLAVPSATASALGARPTVALEDPEGRTVGTMDVTGQ